MTTINRREFVGGTIATGAWLAAGRADGASPDGVYREVERRHAESIERLRRRIGQGS